MKYIIEMPEGFDPKNPGIPTKEILNATLHAVPVKEQGEAEFIKWLTNQLYYISKNSDGGPYSKGMATAYRAARDELQERAIPAPLAPTAKVEEPLAELAKRKGKELRYDVARAQRKAKTRHKAKNSMEEFRQTGKGNEMKCKYSPKGSAACYSHKCPKNIRYQPNGDYCIVRYRPKKRDKVVKGWAHVLKDGSVSVCQNRGLAHITPCTVTIKAKDWEDCDR